jgi:uncharacterized protein (TIGR03086 family)
MEANVIDQIDRALVITGAVVHGVDDSQWSLPTLCADWDVHDLVNHMVGGLRLFTAALRGTPSADHESDWLGADPLGAWTSAATADAIAWREPAALDGTLDISLGPVPGSLGAVIHLTEIVAHGADLAVASGQEHLLDQEMIEGVLDMMTSMGIDAFRVPRVFGPETRCEPDDAAHVRLLAFLGRPIQDGTRRDEALAV